MHNPSAEDLDDLLNKILKNSPSSKTECVIIYYIGHGVEYKGDLHAVLDDNKGGRIKYNLEGKADELAQERLVHVMFDCSRLWW